MQRYIKKRTKQNNSHFFLYYSRFAVPLHPQNVIKMKDICCIGHVTKDKIVTPSSTVYMAGGTSFYFAYAINQLPKDVSFSLITAMDPTEKEPVEKMLKAGIDVTLNPSRNTVFFENIYGENPNDRKQRVLAKADPFTIQQLEHVEAKVFHLGSLLSDEIGRASCRERV